MLNKKSAFKPKAAIRRPAPGPGSQGAQRPSAAERPSNTPAPQESSSQSTPAPTPGPSAEIIPPVSGNATPEDAGAPSKGQEKEVEPVVQASITSTPETAPAGTPESRPAAPPQTEKPSSQGTPTVRGPVASAKPAADTSASAKSGTKEQTAAIEATAAPIVSPEVPIISTDSTATETPSSAQTPTISTTAPTPAVTQATATPAEHATDEQSQPPTNATLEPAAGTAEAAKPKRGRKRTTAPTPGEDSGEQGGAAPPPKRPRKRAAPLPGEEGYKPAAPRATRSRKGRGSAAEDGGPEEDDAENTEGSKRRPPRPQREATPPDAETVEIDITQVKMADLAKDMHIGKKFSLHDELMERERAKRLRYIERRKRHQSGEDAEDTPGKEEPAATTPSASNPDTSTQPTPAATEDTPAPDDSTDSGPSRAPIGETYQIIDGEIVLDHRSLQVDRHARAREAAGELVEIEENDFTNHTTSATYLRRNLKPQQWTDAETDLFYQALQAFGTDFDTICRMFKGKTRKHIKLKFNREERVNPQRITAALVGQKTVSIDMETYQRATGQEYETAEAIYAEQQRAEEEFEARQKALEDEKAEEVRRKKEEVLAQLNSAVDGESG